MSGVTNETIKSVAFIAVAFSLSACGAIPTAEDYARKNGTYVAGEGGTQVVAGDSGLGTINQAGERSAQCRRQRSTGSNIGRSSCRAYDSGSQPVSEITYREQPPIIQPGQIGPRNSN